MIKKEIGDKNYTDLISYSMKLYNQLIYAIVDNYNAFQKTDDFYQNNFNKKSIIKLLLSPDDRKIIVKLKNTSSSFSN